MIHVVALLSALNQGLPSVLGQAATCLPAGASGTAQPTMPQLLRWASTQATQHPQDQHAQLQLQYVLSAAAQWQVQPAPPPGPPPVAPAQAPRPVSTALPTAAAQVGQKRAAKPVGGRKAKQLKAALPAGADAAKPATSLPVLKRARHANSYFNKEELPRLSRMDGHGGLVCPPDQRMAWAARAWGAMSQEQKAPYEALAETDKERWRTEKEALNLLKG